MMEFKYTHKDIRGEISTEISYVTHDADDLHSVMQEFRHFLLAVSFHPDSVEKYIEAN